MWKTPERKNEYECSVRLREGLEAGDVLRKVKTTLKTAKVGGLKGVWLVKGGRVVVEGNGEKQRKLSRTWRTTLNLSLEIPPSAALGSWSGVLRKVSLMKE